MSEPTKDPVEQNPEFEKLKNDYKEKLHYDIEADPKRYWKFFCQFDEDASGSITRTEMYAMIESLGMAFKQIEMDAMIKAADTDCSGTIEFDEFYNVLEKSSVSAQLAAVVKRKMNSKELSWREERKGAAVTVDQKTISYSATEGWGVALLGPFVPGDDKPAANKASILLEVDAPDGPVWVGCVGRNFNPEGDHWNQDFAANEKGSLCVGCRSTDGKVFKFGVMQEAGQIQGIKFGMEKTKGLQIDVNMDDRSLNMLFLDETNHYEPKETSAYITDLKSEIGFAVCLGPVSAGGKPSTVRLVGSSAESAERKHRRASKDTWEEDNVQTMENSKSSAAPNFVPS